MDQNKVASLLNLMHLNIDERGLEYHYLVNTVQNLTETLFYPYKSITSHSLGY